MSMGMLVGVIMLMVVFMGGMTSSISIALVEGKGTPQVLTLPVWTSG